MFNHIKNQTKSCETCVYKSGNCYKPYRSPLPMVSRVEPFEMVVIDTVGPLPIQRSGYRYLLTLIDHASHWLEAIPLTNISAQSCTDAFEKGWVN